jgi:hypothetical protein
MKQRVEWDRQAAEETLVSPMLVDRLIDQCVNSGYAPNIGINSLMSAAGMLVVQCLPQGLKADEILRKHLQAAADEIETLDGYMPKPAAMVN